MHLQLWKQCTIVILCKVFSFSCFSFLINNYAEAWYGLYESRICIAPVILMHCFYGAVLYGSDWTAVAFLIPHAPSGRTLQQKLFAEQYSSGLA